MKKIIQILTIISTLVSILIIILSKSPTGTLISIFTDHLRETTYSILFTKAGFKIFYEPMIDIVREYKLSNTYVTWPLVPFDRPLGCALIFLPFAYMENSLKLPIIVVNKLEIIFLIILTGAGIYILFNDLARRRVSKLLIIILMLIFIPYLMFWAMNGIYDVIAFFLIVLALQYLHREKYLNAILFLSLALFIHYRAVIYLPLLLYMFLIFIAKRDNLNIKSICIMVISIILIGITVYTGYLTFIKFPYDEAIRKMMTYAKVLTNPLNLSSLSNPLLIIYIMMLIIVLYMLYMYSDPRDFILTSSCILSYTMLLFFHPIYQFWYPITAIPMLTIPRDYKSVMIVSLWFIAINFIILSWFILTLSREALASYVHLFKRSISI